MLTLDPPYYFVRGTTVLRDHEDRDLFYFFPRAPSLTSFSLIKYRRDLTDNPALDPTQAKGAGLATFETEFPATDLQRLTSDVARETGREDARVVPVTFRSASVRAIVAHAQGDRLIEDLVETHPAPIVAPHHAAFALALSAEGATLIEQAARGGGLPVGVVYEFQTLALTPSLHARITMDFEQAYDRFAASLAFTYYVRAAIDVEMEWLVEHDFIHIDITSFTDGADAERQRKQVMELVSARVRDGFFRPGLPEKQTDGGMVGPLADLLGGMGGGEISSASAIFTLKAKYEAMDVSKDFVLVYNGRVAVPITHTASGFLSTMVGGNPPDVREIDLDDPFFSSLAVRIDSAIDFDAIGDLTEAAVHLTHGDFRQSYPITRDAGGPFRFEVPITRRDDDQYRYEVEYRFDPERGDGPTSIRSAPVTSRRRLLVVDPTAHFQYRRVRFVLGPVDPQLVPRVRVTVRVPSPDGGDDRLHSTFTLDAGAREHVWRARLPVGDPPIEVRASTAWDDASGVAHPDSEVDVTSDQFLVLGPYHDVLKLLVQPTVDWAKVNLVVVELRYVDGDYRFDKQLELTAAGRNAGVRLEIPLRDPRRRSFEWRQTVVRSDGTSDATDWQSTDQGVLVVPQQRPTSADVRVVWVGAPGDAFGLRIDLFATVGGEERQASAFLRAGEGATVITVPLGDDGQLAYRYEVHAVTAGGDRLVRSGESKNALLVVQSSQ